VNRHPFRVAAALLTLASIALPAQPGAATASGGPGSRVGVPWRGESGITETVAEIMARERRADGTRSREVIEDLSPLRRATPKRPSPTPAAEAPGPRTFESAIPPTPGVSFHATDLGETPAIPPDTMGSVGPTQILVHTNGRVKLFDKAGNVGALNVGDDTFWSSVRAGFPISDPHVEYDRLSEHWFLTIINVPPSGANRVLVAVTSGPTITDTSSFTFFQFRFDQVGTTPNVDTGKFADYPTLGVDTLALYIGVNVFHSSTGGFSDTTGFVVDKADLIASTLTVTAFRGLVGPTSGPYTPQGVHNQDPGATEGYFVGVDFHEFDELVIRRITDPGGTPIISSDITLTVPSTQFPMGGVPQPSGPLLDDIDDRLFAAMIARDPSGQLRLWTAHNIEVDASGVASVTGNRDGSRWYEIGSLTGTPTLVQSGTLFDSAASSPHSFWMPSIAANGQGHAVIGASRAGSKPSTGFAGAAVAERLASDPLGTLGTPSLVQSSSFSYDTGVPGIERWGDYSQTVIDPNDNMTFWTFQEYTSATNQWGVRVVQLVAPPPATPSAASPSTVPACGTTSVEVTGASTGGSGFFDPGPDTGGPGFADHIDASVTPDVTVESVAFTDPTHVSLTLDTLGASVGSKDVTVTNPDGQGATGPGIVTVSASGDTTDPAAFDLLSPDDGAIVGVTPTVSWDASSDTGCGLERYQLWVDGSLNRDNIDPATTSTTPIGPLGEGPHTWFVRAIDGAGNDTDSPTRSFTVDATPPLPFDLLSPPNGATVNTASPTLSWEATSDALSGLAEYRLFVDGTLSRDDISSGTTSTTPGSPLAEGSHTWFVRAADNLGNTRDSSQRSLTVDLPGSHDRDLTLRLRKHLRARGRLSVADGFAACFTGAEVEIQRRKGGWRTVKKATADATGAFSARLRDREGTYRAIVAEETIGVETCHAATSPSRRHRH
jgi:hypothetical protein